ncbi:DUF4129 domain-containing protein [Saliphagus sp. GCM10025334]
MPSTETLLRLAVALLVIVAIGLVAATITTPIDPGSDGTGFGDGDGEGSGQGASEGEPYSDNRGDEPGTPPEFLQYLVYALLIMLALVVVWYLISNRRDLVKIGAATILITLILSTIVYLLLKYGEQPEFVTQNQTYNTSNNSSGGGGTSGTGSRETDVPLNFGPLLGVLALVATIFVGGLVLSKRGSSTGGTASVEEGQDGTNTERAAVAAAAGRAADRIADESSTGVDNEIYRAWREMTDLLEVDRPESTTPREFAAVAVDAGLERDHVEELTGLFEAVRYGHEDTTDEREERAVSILRAIESTYGETDAASRDGRGDDR